MGCLIGCAGNCNNCECECGCCCNQQEKCCYQFFIIISSICIFVFQLVLVALSNNSLKPEEFEFNILSETPLYDFEINQQDVINKKNVTFFEFKGRKKKEGSLTKIIDEINFNKIFNNKFLYNGKDKNYFNYVNKYSVSSGNNCPTDYKKCGILDSAERILCLPNSEACPLNGFGISNIDSDSNYNGYEKKEVEDSTDGSKYYLYYTNTNTEGKIITEFKLSAGTPCATSSELNWYKYYKDEVVKEYGCKSVIDNRKYSNRYIQVSNGIINMKNLYKENGLTDPPNDDNFGNPSVSLYARNYNEIDEKCFEKFIKDFKDEKKYYSGVLIAIRGLGAISIVLIVSMFIYMFALCCNVKFYSISFVVSVYGILFNIIVLVLIAKKRIKYTCHIDEFNEELDNLVKEQYYVNLGVNIIMCCLSLAFYFIVWIFTLCLQFMRYKQ
jgi:hypothetical protein